MLGIKKSLLILLILVTLVALCDGRLLVFGTEMETSVSRPNVSGGYDYFDSSGKKTSYSTKRNDGGYDYYDQYGNRIGAVVPVNKDPKKRIPNVDIAEYKYYDADNIPTGKIVSDPYGGYRYYEEKEGVQTPSQMSIRRDYVYSDTYGKNIGTLSNKILRGQPSGLSSSSNSSSAALSTSGSGGGGSGKTDALNTSTSSKGLETSAQADRWGARTKSTR